MIFPAIDLKSGQSVRLYQGDFQRVTPVNNDPVAQARQIQAAGLTQLHLVDLDGAKTGENPNLTVVTKIRAAFQGMIELGGGIRTLQQAQTYYDLGIDRLIVGSAALEQPALVTEMIQKFGPEKVVVGIDGRRGKVATAGWLSQSNVSMQQLMTQMVAKGVQLFVVTDVSRDGTLQGPNVEQLTQLQAEFPAVTVIASGGIRNLADVQALQAAGLSDVIVGKALAAGKVSLQELAEVTTC